MLFKNILKSYFVGCSVAKVDRLLFVAVGA